MKKHDESQQNTRLASLAKWLSVRLRTKWCGFESRCSHLQECYLRLMTNNYELSYKELLDLTNKIFPHQRCLNSLMTEVYKFLNRLSPNIFETPVKYSPL